MELSILESTINVKRQFFVVLSNFPYSNLGDFSSKNVSEKSIKPPPNTTDSNSDW